MACLKEITQSVFDVLYPNGGDETPIKREHVLIAARSEYSYQMQLYYWAEKQREGTFEIPSHLLSQTELPVVNNEIDISGLSVFRSFGIDSFIQNIGGFACKCKYVKSSVNRRQLLCDFESIDDSIRPYVPLGEKILFPEGAHDKKLTIIYTNKGETVDEEEPIDDFVGGIVRTRLIEIFTGKVGQPDETNNTNPSR